MNDCWFYNSGYLSFFPVSFSLSLHEHFYFFRFFFFVFLSRCIFSIGSRHWRGQFTFKSFGRYIGWWSNIDLNLSRFACHEQRVRCKCARDQHQQNQKSFVFILFNRISMLSHNIFGYNFFFHWICVEWMWRTCMAKNNKKCSFCDVHKSCRLYESCSAICMYRTGTILNGNARDKQRIKTDRTSIFFRQSAKVLKPKSGEWATKMARGQ